MNKRVRFGVLLMLIGIGIPSVLLFFQEDGSLFNLKTEKLGKALPSEDGNYELVPVEKHIIHIPYRYSIGLGLILFFLGVGFVVLPLIGMIGKKEGK